MKKEMKPQRRFKGFTGKWERRKLGDEAIEIIAGGDIDNAKITKRGRYPIYANAVKGNDIIGYYNDYYRVEAPAVTVAGRGAVGYARARFVNFTPVVRLLSIRSKHDCTFLENAINNHRIIIESTGVPQLTVPQLSSYDICFPPSIEEEIKIGEFFSNLDNLITLNQRKLDKLRDVKKAYLAEMFPRPGEKQPRRRFKGFTGDWEKRKLSEIATMHARIGWQNLRTSEFLDEGKYILITGTDFDDGRVKYDTCHYVEKERFEQDKNIQIRDGSILITKDGTLGKVAYVQGLPMPATLNAGVFNVEVIDKNKTDEQYLFQYLKAPFLMNYVKQRATGGTIKHLNQSILVDFPVDMPSKLEQERIGEFFSNLDNLITLHQRKLDKLQALKKAYLAEMFV